MLRGTCKHCRMKFRPKRSDAEFCGNPCRQAFYRVHKRNAARDQAAAAFETLEQRQSEQKSAALVEWYEAQLRNPPTSVVATQGRVTTTSSTSTGR